MERIQWLWALLTLGLVANPAVAWAVCSSEPDGGAGYGLACATAMLMPYVMILPLLMSITSIFVSVPIPGGTPFMGMVKMMAFTPLATNVVVMLYRRHFVVPCLSVSLFVISELITGLVVAWTVGRIEAHGDAAYKQATAKKE